MWRQTNPHSLSLRSKEIDKIRFPKFSLRLTLNNFGNQAGEPGCRIQIPEIVQGGSRSDFGNCSGIWLDNQAAAFKFPESFLTGLIQISGIVQGFFGRENTMPFRTPGLEQGEFYHFYNRGNNKQRIFFERENYHYFLRTFGSYFTEDIAEMCAFCLMPNHYHILLRLTSDCDYSKHMQHFGIAYVKAMNRRYERCGHLFQGRFKAKLIDSDEYLIHLSRYIHLNPMFAKVVRKAEDWEFSSYPFYLGEKEFRGLKQSGNPVVNTSYILSQFASVAEYRSYVESFAAEKMLEMSERLWREG